MSDYCHLCDFDPCTCGQHGKVEVLRPKSAQGGSPRGIDDDIREFVLSSHEAGIHENWQGWLDRLAEKFGPDREALRGPWNRVNNALQREWILIDDPDEERYGPMMPPAHYPEVRRLTVPQAIAAVEELIASGGWTVDEPGLRLAQVWRRIPNVVYISIYDALHDMNGRNHLVTTKSPAGKNSQFWYVKP